MPDTLPVHLNRESLHSLDVPTGVETDGSFDVLLANHGEAVHVHLHLDDALSRVASIDANNHYVQAESERPVRVTVRHDGDVYGKLKVVTGYGATTRYVDVDLTEPEESDDSVQVDESLATPKPKEPSTGDGARIPAALDSPVYLLGGLALLLAVAVSLAVPSTTVRLGTLVVFLTVLAGLVLAWFD